MDHMIRRENAPQHLCCHSITAVLALQNAPAVTIDTASDNHQQAPAHRTATLHLPHLAQFKTGSGHER